jgi:hypothetical protein
VVLPLETAQGHFSGKTKRLKCHFRNRPQPRSRRTRRRVSARDSRIG